jgi:hypothetical protein
MNKLILALSVVAIALSGCQTAPMAPKPLPLVEQKQTVQLPPSLLVDCQDLTKLDPTQNYSQGASVDIIAQWAAEHRDCVQRFAKVRNLAAQAFNIHIDEHGNVVDPVTVSK